MSVCSACRGSPTPNRTDAQTAPRSTKRRASKHCEIRPWVGPVVFAHPLGFFSQIGGLRRGHLHAEGQLVLFDAGQRLGILVAMVGQLVEFSQRVQGFSPQHAVHPHRIGRVQYRRP